MVVCVSAIGNHTVIDTYRYIGEGLVEISTPDSSLHFTSEPEDNDDDDDDDVVLSEMEDPASGGELAALWS